MPAITGQSFDCGLFPSRRRGYLLVAFPRIAERQAVHVNVGAISNAMLKQSQNEGTGWWWALSVLIITTCDGVMKH